MDDSNPQSTNLESYRAPSQTNAFDEVPIRSNTNKFNINEFAQEDNTPLTENMTLEQKIQSKAIKIRLEGLEQLRNLLVDKNGQIQFQIQLCKLLKQNNPACLQKALICAQKLIEQGKNWSDKQVKQIIENGCINGKGNTKKSATQLVFKLFEARPEEVQTAIQSGLKSKTPKIIGGYLALINELLQQFGIKDLKYLKPYFSILVKILNNEKLPVVKTEGMNLLKGGLRWMGKDFVWIMISELKQNMKKELQSFWESHDKKQIVKANRQKNILNTHINFGVIKQKNQEKETPQNQFMSATQGIDIYEISDPVQVFSKYDQKWTECVLEAEKWNTKITFLQQLITKSSVPKIANSQHRHVVEMIRRLLGDSNFNVQLTALKLTNTLAKGLRKNFTHSAKILFPYIIAKLRDKKNQMIEETLSTLKSFCLCLSFEQVGEDLKSALKDKSSGMKNNIIKWMTSGIEKKLQNNCSSSQRLQEFLKNNSMQTIIQGLLNDPTADVRDSTAKFVCKCRNIWGESLFKDIDKCINNKDILNRVNDGGDNQESPAKSRGKDRSKAKSQKSGSKAKPNRAEEEQVSIQKSYVVKTSNGQHTVDISQQINKNMKKLNDSSNWQNRKQSAERLIKFFAQLEKDNPNAKITSPNIHDFLSVLKSRISDPNKQLVKIFVNLMGEVVRCLPEKQVKIQGKFFVQELIEVFSDKNEGNKKEVFKTLDRFCQSLDLQSIISFIGQILSQQTNNSSTTNQLNSVVKQCTFEYLLNNEQFMSRVEQINGGDNLKEFKEYPKIILSGLCDKNKEWRNMSERMFKIISEKTGVQAFRTCLNSKDIKSAFRTDLNAILDKLDGQGTTQQQSMMSNGSFLSLTNVKQSEVSRKRSPSASQSKIGTKQQTPSIQNIRRKVSNLGSLRSSRSKNKNNSILICDENSKQYSSNLFFALKDNPLNSRVVEGNEMFANISVLTSERVAREENSSKYRYNSQHPIFQQQQIQSSLSRLVNYQELYLKMYSNDYKKNLEVSQKLIKACRDVAQTNSIREIADLLLKWVIIKLYGGNVPVIGLIQLICPVLTVLEKKKIAWTDFDIDILIHLTKQYLVTSFYDGSTNVEAIKNMLKLAIALSSGERIIKKILLQLKTDIGQIHRHAGGSKREGMSCNAYYKKYLCQICGFLVDYFSNDELLLEASKIPELNQDFDFIKLLASKFHEGVLQEFGFKLDIAINSNHDSRINMHKTTLISEKSERNNSSRSVSPGIAYFGGSSNTKIEQRSQKKTPLKTNSHSNTNYQSHFPPPSPSPIHKSGLIQQSILPLTTALEHVKKVSSINQIYKNVGLSYNNDGYELDLSKFAQPSHHNPLGSNLHKLYPYNESTVHFFSTLFQPQNQNSEKIVCELTTHCNVIYSSLFNALIKLMDPPIRDTLSPDKIISFLALIQQGIKCRNIYKNLNEDLIEKSMKYTIDQLVYEDENKTSVENKLRLKGFTDFKGDSFIKGINGVMLRILDNSQPLLLVNCLLLNLIQTIYLNRNGEDSKNALPILNRNKKMGLLIRCFTRVTASYFGQGGAKEKEGQIYNIDEDPSCLKSSHVVKFILQAKQYLDLLEITDLIQYESQQLSKIQKTTTCNTQQSVVSSICTILKVLNKKNLLANPFDQIRKQKSTFKLQNTLSHYIDYVSQSLMGLNILCPNNHQDHPYSTTTSSHKNYINEQIRGIVQLLSKAKTFSEGVKQLKIFIQQGGGKFDPKTYFTKMNFDQIFIDKVLEELNTLNKLQTQNSSRSLNPDIQGKLDRLKMKLQGINNQHSNSISQKNGEKVSGERGNYLQSTRGVMENKTPKVRDLSTKNVEQSSNQTDLKKRIEEMKNKVSMSTANRLR